MRHVFVISTDAYVPTGEFVRDWTYKKSMKLYCDKILQIIDKNGALRDFDYSEYDFHKTRLRGVVETDKKGLTKIAKSVTRLDNGLRFHIIKQGISFEKLDSYMYDPFDLDEISETSFPIT